MNRPVGKQQSLGTSRPGAAAESSWQDDPLRKVDELGRRSSRFGMALGLVFALSTHGAGSARALSALIEMRDVMVHMRQELHEFFWATYDVDVVEEKEEEKKDEPEPEPEPEPLPPPPVDESAPAEPEDDDPYEDDPPPAPGEAAKILTAADDPRAPVDMTDDGFVSGPGDGAGYGYVSSMGTAKKPTYDPNATVGGKEGGKGKPRPKKPRPPPVNKSKPAGLVGGTSWNCPFPPEADIEQIDRATAVIVVTVSKTGRPGSVRVLSDPGYGFGRAARQCALGRRYTPARNRAGEAVRSTTPPINVRFRR